MKNVDFFKTISLKIWVVLLVIAALILGLTILPAKQVAKTLDLQAYEALPQYGVQELRAWGQGRVRVSDEPLDMDGYRLYRYKLDKSLLEQYLQMLQENGFTLVDEYHQSSFVGSYQAYGLLCDSASNVETLEMMFTDTPCHVSIWKDDSKWRVEVANGLTMCDLGLRQDGTRVSTRPAGESLGAGLRRLSGGRYKTSDSRLKTKPGEAAIIVNGQEGKAAADWKRSGDKVYVTVQTEAGMSVEIMYKEKQVQPGKVFLLNAVEEQPVTVTVAIDDEKISAKHTGALQFHNIALRVMYLGEDADAVLYLYAEPMDTENYPRTLELLLAVNTTPEKSKDQGGGGGGIRFPWEDDEPFQPNHSKLDCLTCRGSGDCTTCGGDGYTGFGDAKAGCRSCHGNGNCTACGGSGKR